MDQPGGRGRASTTDTGTSDGEDGLAALFSTFARAAQEKRGLHDTLVEIVRAAVELVPGCDEGSISVVLGRRRVTSEAPSGELPRIVDDLQETLGEYGAIVVVGSWMAHVGHPFVGLYSATKAAEIQLSRSWAAEFGPRGVRVNTVSPGATRTPVNASSGDVVDRMTSGTPAGRPGTPDEIADAVSWLLSDGARYVHGAEIAVDGGITATRTG